jgi:hypothetical protein
MDLLGHCSKQTTDPRLANVILPNTGFTLCSWLNVETVKTEKLILFKPYVCSIVYAFLIFSFFTQLPGFLGE